MDRVEALHFWGFSQTTEGTNGTYREDVWGPFSYTLAIPGLTANRAFNAVTWYGDLFLIHS
jgi:hypothetical protein